MTKPDPETPFPWERHDERLVLETPEQTQIEYRIAPLGTRLVAAVIDRAVILALVAVLLIAAMLAFTTVISSVDFAFYQVAVLVALYFLVTTLYLVWSEVRGEGQTFGKRRVGIRTVLANGRAMTLGASFVRNLARLVDEIPLLWIVPFFTTGHRRIGDLLAGTYVVTDEHAAKKTGRVNWISRLAPSYRQLAEIKFPLPADAHRTLLADDLNLLEYLEERVNAVPRHQRRQLFTGIALSYVERISLQAESDRVSEDPERFLQELGLFLRERFAARKG